MYFVFDSGMDVLAKRQVWKIIRREVSAGRSVILTSHSMEECEELCTRLAIMEQGRFLCLGTPGHIKAKYGRGFTLQLAFESSARQEAGAGALRERFPRLVNLKQHRATVTCRVPGERISDVLHFVLRVRDELGIKDFSVRQTSLDEVRMIPYYCLPTEFKITAQPFPLNPCFPRVSRFLGIQCHS